MWILPKNYQLSSHFVQDMVASKEDLTLPGLSIESSLMWRSKPSPLLTWCQKMENGQLDLPHLFTRILKPSQVTLVSRTVLALITGRYPCQPFSAEQGSGLVEDDPRHLWPSHQETPYRRQSILDNVFFRERRRTHLAWTLHSHQRLWKNDGYLTRRGEYSQRG